MRVEDAEAGRPQNGTQAHAASREGGSPAPRPAAALPRFGTAQPRHLAVGGACSSRADKISNVDANEDYMLTRTARCVTYVLNQKCYLCLDCTTAPGNSQ